MIQDIRGFEGLYTVNDNGQIYSIRSNKYLKPRKDKDGYLLVNLYKEKKQYTRKVHRLVAEAFLDNPEDKAEVNHIDMNRQNNEVSNLEWVSHRENIIWQAENGKLFPNRNLTYHF